MIRYMALGITLLLLASRFGGAVEISIVGDPPLPATNLLKNAAIEEEADGQPAHWRFSTARPDIFEAAWRDNGRSGKCLWLKAKSGEMSGYWNQSFAVPSGRPILIRGYFRLLAGKILIYAHTNVKLPDGRQIAVDERFYRGTMRGHWLVPVFLPPEALGGPDPNLWHPFRLLVNVPEGVTALTLSLGLYFQAGEAYFDDLWVGLAETDLKISVQAEPPEALRQIVVTSSAAEKPIFTSPLLPADTRHYETTLQRQPTDAVYLVRALLADGRSVERRYPKGEEH